MDFLFVFGDSDFSPQMRAYTPMHSFCGFHFAHVRGVHPNALYILFYDLFFCPSVEGSPNPRFILNVCYLFSYLVIFPWEDVTGGDAGIKIQMPQ